MTWNYRVVRQVVDGEWVFGIHEAFYNDDGSLWTFTTNPVEVAEQSLADLRDTLLRMLDALEDDVIEDV